MLLRRFWISTLAQVSLFLFVTACIPGSSRRDATTVEPRWFFEGWACAPRMDMIEKGIGPHEYCASDEPREYLYTILTAQLHTPEEATLPMTQRKKECIAAAQNRLEQLHIEGILLWQMERSCSTGGCSDTEVFVEVALAKKDPASEQIYACCSIDLRSGKCSDPKEPEHWSECACMVTARYYGGKEAFSDRE
jgi:hypothetical protein